MPESSAAPARCTTVWRSCWVAGCGAAALLVYAEQRSWTVGKRLRLPQGAWPVFRWAASILWQSAGDSVGMDLDSEEARLSCEVLACN